jgi:hypothetical protein
MKIKTEPKPVQIDRFRFGSVILEQKPVFLCLTQFFGLARFFLVWLGFFSGLAVFFCLAQFF